MFFFSNGNFSNLLALMLLRLGLDILSLSRDGLEASFDGLHRAGALTGHALEEEQPGLLDEDGVRGPAGVAGHVLLDVTPQHVLYVLLLETSF